MHEDRLSPNSFAHSKMKRVECASPKVPGLSDASRGIKRCKKDPRALVQKKFHDLSKQRYQDLLNAVQGDKNGTPSWSLSKSNGSFGNTNSPYGSRFTKLKLNTPEFFKNAQEFVLQGGATHSPHNLSRRGDAHAETVDGNKTKLETETQKKYESAKILPSRSKFSSFSLSKCFSTAVAPLTPLVKSFVKPQNLFSTSTISELRLNFARERSIDISPPDISGKELDSATDHVTPPTIDLIDSPPSSTPAHSPQSSSSLTQRSSSTPSVTTTTITSSFTTATNLALKSKVTLSLHELKLNESTDNELLEAEAKVYQARNERVQASNDFASKSSVAPQKPFFPGFIPPLRTELEGDEEEEEDEEDEDEIVSPELEKEVPNLSVIEAYIRPKLSNVTEETILVTKFNYEIRAKDIVTLQGLNWLNDEVINFYFQLIMQRSQQVDNLPKVYAFSTFFYDKLRASENSYATLKRWTRRVDIFSFDFILIPLHLGMHWALASINCTAKRICYYDSLTNTSLINEKGHVHQVALLKYLELEHMEKKGSTLPADWAICAVGEDENGRSGIRIPQQENGSDCGVFSCKFAECISRRSPFNFSQVIYSSSLGYFYFSLLSTFLCEVRHLYFFVVEAVSTFFLLFFSLTRTSCLHTLIPFTFSFVLYLLFLKSPCFI